MNNTDIEQKIKKAIQYLEWIERLANSKKVWTIRQIAREGLDEIKAEK